MSAAPRSPCANRMPGEREEREGREDQDEADDVAHVTRQPGTSSEPERQRAEGELQPGRAVERRDRRARTQREQGEAGGSGERAARPTTFTRTQIDGGRLVVEASALERRPLAWRRFFDLALALGCAPRMPLSSAIEESGTHLRDPGRITGLSPSIRPWESQVRRADRSMGPISLPSPSLTLNPAMSPRIYTL